MISNRTFLTFWKHCGILHFANNLFFFLAIFVQHMIIIYLTIFCVFIFEMYVLIMQSNTKLFICVEINFCSKIFDKYFSTNKLLLVVRSFVTLMVNQQKLVWHVYFETIISVNLLRPFFSTSLFFSILNSIFSVPLFQFLRNVSKFFSGMISKPIHVDLTKEKFLKMSNLSLSDKSFLLPLIVNSFIKHPLSTNFSLTITCGYSMILKEN